VSRKKIKSLLEVSPEKLKKVITKEIRAELYKGPMPSPDLIERYSKLYPDAPEFFFSLMQKQTDHRINIEEKVISSNIIGERIGQVFAFIICVIAIASGVYLIMNNKDAAGISSILLSLGGVIGIFFVRKQRSRNELKKK